MINFAQKIEIRIFNLKSGCKLFTLKIRKFLYIYMFNDVNSVILSTWWNICDNKWKNYEHKIENQWYKNLIKFLEFYLRFKYGIFYAWNKSMAKLMKIWFLKKNSYT